MSGATGGSSDPESDEKGVFERLLEGATDQAMFMLDSRWNISMWPNVAERLYGMDADDTMGKRLNLLFADEPEAERSVAEILATAKAGTEHLEAWHQRADGSVFWAECTLSPLRNHEFDGYSVVVRDITSRKQYERMLEQQNDRLKEFTDILSHDLRTPLSVIDGRLQLFKQTGNRNTSKSSRRRTTGWRSSSRTCSAWPDRDG